MPPDESIVPRKPGPTPVLRADATDDELDEPQAATDGTRFAKGGVISHWDHDEELPAEKVGPDGRVDGQFKLLCPICGLETCGHNLPKEERFVPDAEAGHD